MVSMMDLLPVLPVLTVWDFQGDIKWDHMLLNPPLCELLDGSASWAAVCKEGNLHIN